MKKGEADTLYQRSPSLYFFLPLLAKKVSIFILSIIHFSIHKFRYS